MKSKSFYLITAFVIAFAVLLLVPLWYVLGAVGGEGHAHAVKEIMTRDVFTWHLKEQQRKYGLPDGSVKIADAGEVFILAQQFAFIPKQIRLETGKAYMLHFYSPDVHHGASLVANQPHIGQALGLHTVIPPGIVSMVTFTPHLPGEILLACTEYCGLGHHVMEGKIIMEGQPFSMEMVPWYQRIQMIKLSTNMWMYHDLYYSQFQAQQPGLLWDPLPSLPGLFMAPHQGWPYWHYHGPPGEEKKHLEAAVSKLSDAPPDFKRNWELPPEKTGFYR